MIKCWGRSLWKKLLLKTCCHPDWLYAVPAIFEEGQPLRDTVWSHPLAAHLLAIALPCSQEQVSLTMSDISCLVSFAFCPQASVQLQNKRLVICPVGSVGNPCLQRTSDEWEVGTMMKYCPLDWSQEDNSGVNSIRFLRGSPIALSPHFHSHIQFNNTFPPFLFCFLQHPSLVASWRNFPK